MDSSGKEISCDSRYDRALLHSVIIDKGYMQVAAHIDESTKERILNFQYIDFGKLLPQDRIVQQEDQRLTLVNKGGIPYLVPAADNLRENGISNYGHWDQAFWVFSEVMTSRYPNKAQELIQYNHIIHTAAQTYIWDNVYSYDKDFRIHVSKNPTRTWSVILHQAWAMRLKDKIREFGNPQNQGSRGDPALKARITAEGTKRGIVMMK